MAFKFVVLTTLLACANAGFLSQPAIATYSAAPAVSSSYLHQSAPVAVAHASPVYSTYSAAPVSIHAPAYGASHQSVERSLGGAQSVSHYSKAVDSAFSSVRKYDTRITNDALSVAPVATYAAHAPVATYASAPVFTKTVAPLAYSAAPAVSSSYIHQASSPVYAAQAPVATYASAPVIAKAVAPVAYAHAPVATYATHAPVATYAAHAPVATYAAHAPVATYAAHAAPVAYSAGPVVTKSAIAYSPATVVSHATFTGLGASYQW
ncbi:unnamed protein product [Phaedon cochleariae]|uniref:Uncharacterized protein n=1 Tax=Phaedon cochleariae TaxID=80249 RepID=A0A9P0GUU2_PHACE|nr:unnamed protein product [Phaedon cochleariae]